MQWFREPCFAKAADQRSSVTSYRQRCQKFGTFLSAHKYSEWNFRHFSVPSSRFLALAFGPRRACFRSFYGTGQKIHSGLPVLHKCANPACSNRFRHLNLGKLFQVEKPFLPVSVSRYLTTKRRTRSPRRTEHYWLCDPCSLLLTLTFEKGSGMITVPLPAAIRKVAADSCLIELRAATAQT